MENKIVTVTNISAIKRIAYFLCDLIINFFFSLMIVNFAIFPIGRSVINFDEKVETISQCENNKVKILEDNQMLLYKEEVDRLNFTNSLEYTYEVFTEKLINDKENETVIYKYFVDIKNDKNTYISLYKILNEKKEYFVINETVTLKDEYKSLFQPYFDPSDALSETGKTEFETFRENVFVDLYSQVINDIKVNDLKSGELSYIAENDLSIDIAKSIENLYSFSTLIGYLLVSIIYFILIPISNENRYTLAQFFLKTNRVDCTTLKPLKKRSILLVSTIQIVANMCMIVLIPSLTIGVETSFSLPYLSILTFLSAIYILVSLFFVIFNEFNKSLYDIFSNSVVIDREDFENILYNLGTK